MELLLNNASLIASALAAVFATAFYFWAIYKQDYWKRRGVEQIPGAHWFFGHFKDAILFRSAPGWHLKKLYEQSSEDAPFFGFYIFQKPCLQLKDPEIIKQIFIKDFDKFSDRYFSGAREKDSIGMRNLFGLRNPTWKYVRSKISPTLTIEKMKKMVPLMLDNGKPMLKYIDDQKPDDNGIKHLDGQDLNCKYATDIIANVGLGIEMDSFKNPDTHFNKRTQLFFHSTRRFRAMFSVFFMPKLVDVLGPLIYFDMSFFKQSFWDTVAMREKTGQLRGDYIDSILKLKNGSQNKIYTMEGDRLLDQAGQFFSGFESGSISASFTLMEIAKNKEVQSRAREDIEKAVAEFGWTYDGINEMKYLEQCVYEGVRLYPAVPFLDRCAKEDYKIPGTNVVIEKGTGVHVPISALHRDPKHFHNPEAFDPDRFENGNYKHDAFLPFGLGPRMCVGSKLGVIHVKVVLAMILKEYEVSYVPLEKSEIARLDPRATFTVADHGLMMQFRKLVK